jgi:undecaprenyl pyrophosphate phosphatase UppP
MTFAGGVEGVWAAVQRWFWSTGGNLFIIGAALSKLMFILMLVQWVRGWLGKSATAPMRELRLRLTREERQRFSLSIGLTVLIAVALAVVLKYGDFKENDFNELVVIPLFLVVGGAYAGLVWTLWKSRPEPRVGVAWLRSGFRFWRRW